MGLLVTGIPAILVVWYRQGSEAADVESWIAFTPFLVLLVIYVANLIRAPRILHEEQLRHISQLERERDTTRKSLEDREKEVLALRAGGATTDWNESGEFEYDYPARAMLPTSEYRHVEELRFHRRHEGDYTVTFNAISAVRYSFEVIEKRRDGFKVSCYWSDIASTGEVDHVQVTWQAVGRG